MSGFFGHREHLFRVGALFVAGVLAFLVLQALLVPKGFGRYGHYRAGALEDNRNRALVHAGRAACLDCHADAAEAAKGGPHEHVRCEACHGALARHAAEPMEQKALRPDSRVLCARCHQANVARPLRFPQVEVADHAGGEACTTCHKAHDPRLPAPGTPQSGTTAASTAALPAKTEEKGQ
jgi:predicted CXXCH cytochrome family protein